MTEDEAKQRWCPMVRLYDPAEKIAVNRPYEDEWTALGVHGDNHYCIGSACMMWRKTDDAIPEYNHPESGYCGRAGKP